ncbi:MAG: type II secretion system minor pseudopilin GspK [Parvularculaceae bacterium]|nr:type II secretion system minor pseudopilin GspK [Parvularculaceae bacterium]
MTALSHPRKDQSGAALIVVLLLVATLAFILLSISEQVKASVERSAADRARAELMWRAAAGREVVRRMLEKVFQENPPSAMIANAGLFAQEFDLPYQYGAASVRFRDATRCFNLNALTIADSGGGGGSGASVSEMDRLARLATALGLGDSEAQKFASVVGDFIDKDSTENIGGAEDGFYTALPIPFRTAGGPIASVTELRAMDGVTRGLYRRLKPSLCAIDAAEHPTVNVNMLNAHDAPLIYAMTNGGWDLSAIRSQIENRPPGGWSAVNDFWAPYTSDGGAPPANSGSLTTSRIEAIIRLEVNGRTMEEKLLFSIDNSGKPELVAHTFGDDY